MRNRLGLLLFAISFLVCFVLFPFNITSDGLVRYQAMESLIINHQVTPLRFSIVGSIFSAPLFWITSFLKVENPIPFIARYNFLIYCGFLYILYRLLKSHFEESFIAIFFIVLTFGSLFPNALLDYFGEVFSTICLALGTVLLSKKSFYGWIFLTLAVVNTPVLIIPVGLIVLYFVWTLKKIRYFAFFFVCFFLIFLEAFLRSGNPLAIFQLYLLQDHGFTTVLPYSGKTGYAYPFFFGILSILFSFGKGIIFFCPGLLLIKPLWNQLEKEREFIILWLLIVAGEIAAYASWWAWYGGYVWGPRFFLFASVPASWAIAKFITIKDKSALNSIALLIVLTFSFWVGINGTVFRLNELNVCVENNYALEMLCWYVPEFSPLWRPFVRLTTLSQKDIQIIALFIVVWVFITIPILANLFIKTKSFYKKHNLSMREIFTVWKF